MEFSVFASYMIGDICGDYNYYDSLLDRNTSSETVKAQQFTRDGPGEFVGDILDHPELLWTDDMWDEDRVTEAQERIRSQGPGLGGFWKDKYDRKAHQHWHEFYKRNKTNFYKDRHYLHVVFPELSPEYEHTTCGPDEPVRLLEVGCGVGNAVIPLLEIHPRLSVVAIDFARSAIELLSEHEFSKCKRLSPSVCDVVNDALPVPDGSLDVILCMFVLSAIVPEKQNLVIRKLFRALKPGGHLLLRDYGRYDEAQLRFNKGSKIEENFYVRQDGTCAYYFDKDELTNMVTNCYQDEEFQFETVESFYVTRQYANRQQKKARYRVWLQAKYRKSLKNSA